MPRLSCWFIRLALVHLVLGFTVGGLMLAQKGGAAPPVVWIFRPAHQELLLVGFMLQLAFGVGFWILPRAAGQTGTLPMNIVPGLLNAGVWLVIAGCLLRDLSGLVLLGRVCEGGAAVIFAMHIWARVRPFRHAASREEAR